MSISLLLQLSIPKIQLSDYECEAYSLEEGVSRLFRLEAFFVNAADLTDDGVVGKPAWFRVRQGDGEGAQERTVGGVVLEFRLLNKIDLNSYSYAVVIGPRLALLDRSRQSAVFAADSELGVKDLLDGLLKGTLYEGATVSTRGVSLDYEIRESVENQFKTAGSADAPSKELFKRTNITKYNESDFQFFSRICESYGIFYFFEPIATSNMVKDRLVVAASNADFTTSSTVKPEVLPVSPADASKPSSTELKFKAATTTISVDEPAVTSLEWVARPALKQFRLRDFSEDKPNTDMLVASTHPEDNGIGEVVEYGDHYLNHDEGTALVEIRAQEEAWQASVFNCESTACALGAGQVFKLKDHDLSSINTDYVVLEMRHEAGKRGPLGYAANHADVPYRSRFTAIRMNQTFRPRRLTPRPVMAGVFNALVEAEDAGTTRAALDGYGRYRVGLGYNETASRNTAGKGSAPVRQAQPYAGSSADSVVGGLHFPLVRNTEVLVGYVNGDPDRPVILGAAFNQNTSNPVTSGSHTTNRLRTTGGLLMELEDGADKSASRYIRFDVPKAVTDLPPPNRPDGGHYLRMGSAVETGDQTDTDAVGSGLPGYSSTVDQKENKNKNKSGSSKGLDYSLSRKAPSVKVQKILSSVTETPFTPAPDGYLFYDADGSFDINVGGSGLMRFGNAYTTQVDEGDSVHSVLQGEHTLAAQNGVTIKAGQTKGDADILIHATNTVTTQSDGDTFQWIYGKQEKYTVGTSLTVFVGFTFTFNASLALTIQSSGVLTITIGLNSTIIAGSKIDLLVGVNVDLKMAKVFKFAYDEVKVLETCTKAKRQEVRLAQLKAATAETKVEQAVARVESIKIEDSNVEIRSERSSIVSEQGSIIRYSGSAIILE